MRRLRQPRPGIRPHMPAFTNTPEVRVSGGLAPLTTALRRYRPTTQAASLPRFAPLTAGLACCCPRAVGCNQIDGVVE